MKYAFHMCTINDSSDVLKDDWGQTISTGVDGLETPQ